MIWLTVNHLDGEVVLNRAGSKVNGRSCYFCKTESCLTQALKGNRLKGCLEGRKRKGRDNHRKVNWPLESQLIHLIQGACTEGAKTCQNTQSKE